MNGSAQGARILVVEDEPHVAADIVLKLQQEAYQVVASCASGSEAMTLAEQFHPDLVLMDIMLPGGMDGIETARHLRRRFGMPVIYLTAHADDALLTRAQITEPFGYILKPCSARELHVVIAMALFKAASEARIKKLAWVSSSLMSICEPVLVTDVASKVSIMNAAAQSLLQITAQAAAGQSVDTVLRLSSASGDHLSEKIVRQAVLSKSCYRSEEPASLSLPDGAKRWIELQASPVEDVAGEMSGAVLLIRDISSRLAADAALHESEQSYRTLVETMSDGLVRIDAHNRLIYVNAHAGTMLGYDVAELLGHELTDLLDENAGCQFRDRPVSSGLGTTGVQDVDMVRKDRRRIPVHVTSTALFDVSGDYSGAIVVLTEMSSRIEAEQVRIRQAEQQRDVLIREVHHRIKNNLQGVTGLLRQHIVERPELQGVIERVISQIRSMAVVYGLQGSERIDELRLCDIIAAICKSAIDVMRPATAPVIESELKTPVCVDKLEAVPIALVLNELICNAMKHVPAADPRHGTSVILSASGNTARVLITNRCMRLPETFDYAAGIGIGTGLLLVKSLLPHDGACLNILQTEQGVCAELLLRPPVILAPGDARCVRPAGAGAAVPGS